MAYWNSRGLRGSSLEELINLTNEKYREHGLALVQKIPTPITPVKLDQENGHIALGYFEKRSTVDYMGIVQGVPICFEAKETSKTALPLQNIHKHQLTFMEDFQKQEGVAFLIVFFALKNEHYFLPYNVLKQYVEMSLSGGKKSVPYEAFEKKYLIETKSGYYLHYLEALKVYLST